ncbi:MAG: hypothetical protein F6K09_24445 [Merismopedia sp. SIO2A8]|nr:hypothetical protein [Merismopedia sp. SIO2A8]
MTTPHLWVVYPRTRPKNEHLHAQIVGIWEPDNLHRDDSDDESDDDLGNTELATATADGEGEVQEAPVSEDETDEAIGPLNTDTTGDDSDVSDDPEEQSENPITTNDEGLQDESVATQESSALMAEEATPQDDSEALEPEAPDSGQTDSAATKLVKPVRPKFSAAAVQATSQTAKESTAPIAQKPVSSDASEISDDVSTPTGSPSTNLKDGYFSIRGEVLQFSPDTQEITVRIRQANRKSASSKDDQPKDDKEFKLQLQGLLQGRVVGYFWDFHVQRNGNNLIVDEANMIGIVPPRKKRRRSFGGKGGGGRGGIRRRSDMGRSDNRPTRSGDRPTPAAPSRRGPNSKPVLKKSSSASPTDSSSDTSQAES